MKIRARISTLPVQALTTWLLVAVAACGGGPDRAPEWAGTVTDSAGVQVVMNPTEGLWTATSAWTVREVLSIGALEGIDAEQFGQIVGVDVDEAGNVYVLDAQAGEIRVFGPEGEHLRTTGEHGQGPGQLGQALGGIFLVDGEMLVPDLQNQRVNRYSPDGESLGSFRVDLTGGIPIRWDGPVSGLLVAQKRFVAFADTAGVAPSGDPIVAMASDGTIRDTLLTLPTGGSFDLSSDGPSFNFFASEPIWDAGRDGRLASGMNAEYRIELRGPDGALQRVVVLPVEPRTVTERDQEVMLDAIREAAMQQGAPPQAVDMMLSRATFAEYYPLFASLLVGPDGTLWAQRIRTGDELAGGAEGTFDPQDLGSTVWDVFDPEGRYLGELEFPGKFQPLRVHENRIYGVARDELDVQSLKGFEVVRPGA
jgi:hypothetical protein